MTKLVNSLLIAATVGLWSGQAIAAGRSIDVAVAYRTNLGAMGSHSLTVRGQDVYVDGRKLNHDSLLLKRRALASLLTVTSEPSGETPCSAGTFSHVVRQSGKQTRTEEGCLTDPRFGSLMSAVKALK